jgi:zinc protease
MLILASGDTEKTAFSDFQKKIDEKLNSNTQIDVIEPFKNYPHKIKVVLIDKPDRTQTQISIAQRGSSFTNPSLDAIQIGNFAFGGGTFLSKLMVELRVKRGWTYGAGSAFKMASQPHSWRVSFFPKNADTPAAIKETLRLLTDLRDHGITQAEFEAAKSSMINSAGFNFNTPEKRIENLMVEKIFNLPEGYHKNFAKRISDISLEDVNQALKKFIEPDHVIIGLVATASITKAALAKELGIKEANIEIADYTF